MPGISEFEVTVWATRPDALLIGKVGQKERTAVWLRRDFIVDPPEAGCSGWVTIPEEKAREMGWE